MGEGALERRAALGGEALRLTPLLAPQELFKRCMELEEGSKSGEGWKAIKSTFKDVKMSMKYFSPKKGERSVGTGRAELGFAA